MNYDKDSLMNIIKETARLQLDPQAFLSEIRAAISNAVVTINKPHVVKVQEILADMGFQKMTDSWSERWYKRINDDLQFEVYIWTSAIANNEVGVYVCGTNRERTELAKEVFTSNHVNQVVNFVANFEVPEKQHYSHTFEGDHYSQDFFIASLWSGVEAYSDENGTKE